MDEKFRTGGKRNRKVVIGKNEKTSLNSEALNLPELCREKVVSWV